MYIKHSKLFYREMLPTIVQNNLILNKKERDAREQN